MMTLQRLNELTQRFAERKIAVVGDFFLDKYLEFDPAIAEVSIETGKIANQVVNIRHSPGAAGTIVSNLVSLGVKSVCAVGFTGDDGEGYELRRDLAQLGCDTEHLRHVAERHTPVYLKPRNTRISGLEGESERYDTRNRVPLPERVGRELAQALRELASRVDAVILVDQVDEEECGVITSGIRQAVAEVAAAHPEVIFWADSRQRIASFQNCILKPNQYEAVNAITPGTAQDYNLDKATEAGRILQERTGKPVFLTASEHGMLVFSDGRCDMVPAVEVDGPIDPTGAGDSATAGAILTLASGGNLLESALVANLVASVTIRQVGTTGTASVNDLPCRLEQWSQLCTSGSR